MAVEKFTKELNIERLGEVVDNEPGRREGGEIQLNSLSIIIG